MVKSIVIDESANSGLESILDEYSSNLSGMARAKPSKTGLLIGTMNDKMDYITYVVSTASPEQTSSAESLNSVSNVERQDEWFLNHALQVHDMLVGGMDILGIYCIDSTSNIAKQLVFKLYKSLHDLDYYKHMKFNMERLVFLIDSSTKNINMKSLDMTGLFSSGDSQAKISASFQPCEIKSDKNLYSEQYLTLNSNFNFNTKFKTPNIKSHNLLKEDFYNALSVDDMFDEEKLICLINDVFVDENKPFVEVSKLIPKSEEESGSYFVTLLENLNRKRIGSVSHKKSLSGGNQNMDSIYELTGVSTLIVQFPKSFSLKQIKRLFVYDLMRSLYARIRLLVEDLDARKEIIGDVQLEDPNSNDASSIEESYQTPNRINIHMSVNKVKNQRNAPVIISDYVFPDETDMDIGERIKQLFDYDITDPDREIIYVEELPPEIKHSPADNEMENMDKASSSSSLSSLSHTAHLNTHQLKSHTSSDGQNTVHRSASSSVLKYGLAAAVAVCSAIFSYYSYKAANFINDDNEV